MRRRPRAPAHVGSRFRTLLRRACLPVAMGALLGCAGMPPSATVELASGAATAMRPGERARLPDRSHLAYTGLRSDSRCPPGVTCVHAGWVELDFVHESTAGARQALVLSTRPGVAPVHAGDWRLELIEVGRGASPVAHVRASARGD